MAGLQVEELSPAGLLLITLKPIRDDRGYFVERFNAARFRAAGVPCDFVQDNHSLSLPGVLRGLHYQNRPRQGKLVGVPRGRIFDVAVDLRPESATFGRHETVELSAENGRLLWIPAGFAHGFCVLGSESADVIYKIDSEYSAAGEGGIHWNDPELAIPWPLREPTVSARDRALPSFEQFRRQGLVWSD